MTNLLLASPSNFSRNIDIRILDLFLNLFSASFYIQNLFRFQFLFRIKNEPLKSSQIARMHMVQINVFNEARVVAVAVAATTSHKTKIQTRFVTIHDKKRRWTTTK